MADINERDSINPHYIFWFVVYLTTFVFTYIALVTFLHVPKENQRFVDTAFGVLLGTVLTGGIAYLIGGSPSKKKEVFPTGTTLDTTSTTTSTMSSSSIEPVV